jgi:hypothetical protein
MCKFTKKLGLDDTIRFSIVMKRPQTTDSKLQEARQCEGVAYIQLWNLINVNHVEGLKENLSHRKIFLNLFFELAHISAL